jgi:hypothetical protein
MFRTRPDRPWDPPSLLSEQMRASLPAVNGPARGLNQPSHLAIPVEAYYRSIGHLEVKAPRFQENRHMKVVRLSAVRTVFITRS